jgi:hypothetical protein
MAALMTTPICPACASAAVLPIVYGMPTPEMVLAEAAGGPIVGGCAIYDDSPIWHCSACKHRWGEALQTSGSHTAHRKLDGGDLAGLEAQLADMSEDERRRFSLLRKNA